MPEVFGLYVILTDPVIGYAASAEAAVRCGVRYLQLRMKETPREMVLETAKVLRSITLGSDTLFIVNDDVTIAAEAEADGVHLGQGRHGSERGAADLGGTGKDLRTLHPLACAVAGRGRTLPGLHRGWAGLTRPRPKRSRIRLWGWS